jgi:hypothetical protein
LFNAWILSTAVLPKCVHGALPTRSIAADLTQGVISVSQVVKRMIVSSCVSCLQERVRMARDLGLDRTAAPGSSSNGSSSSNGWLELSDAAVAPAATDESAATADQAEEALADVAAAPRGEAAPASAAHTELLPKGWAAAAAPPAVVAEDITAAATAVDSSNGTTTYSFNTSSSSSVRDSRPKIFDSAVGTAVDCEAAAAATMAAANSAAATAAAANVASVESSWLYDQERQVCRVLSIH